RKRLLRRVLLYPAYLQIRRHPLGVSDRKWRERTGHSGSPTYIVVRCRLAGLQSISVARAAGWKSQCSLNEKTASRNRSGRTICFRKYPDGVRGDPHLLVMQIAAPFLESSMTGGTEQAQTINHISLSPAKPFAFPSPVDLRELLLIPTPIRPEGP